MKKIITIVCSILLNSVVFAQTESNENATLTTSSEASENINVFSASSLSENDPWIDVLKQLDISSNSPYKPTSMGSVDAPIVVYELESFTCSHCGDFYKVNLPKLEKDFIDTGKVRLVKVESIHNNIDFTLATSLYTINNDKQKKLLVDEIYKNQSELFGENPQKVIDNIFSKMFISSSKAQDLAQNEEYLKQLSRKATYFSEKFGSIGTPFFIITAKDRAPHDYIATLSGNNYKKLKKEIDTALDSIPTND